MIFSTVVLFLVIGGIGLFVLQFSHKFWPQPEAAFAGEGLCDFKSTYFWRKFSSLFGGRAAFITNRILSWWYWLEDRLVKRGRRERFYLFALNLSEKVLRKLKIFNLRFDIWLTKTIKDIQNHPLRTGFDSTYFKDLKDIIKQDNDFVVDGTRESIPEFSEIELDYFNLLRESSDLNHLLNLARLYLSRGHFEEARWALLEAMYRDVRDSVLFSLLKEVYEKEKAVEESGELPA